MAASSICANAPFRALWRQAACMCALVISLCLLSACASSQASSSNANASNSAASASSESSLERGAQQVPLSGFSWSGGSGRLKGITCTALEMLDGQAYATIEIQSASYTTVRVGDSEYQSLTPDSEVSTFKIPVNLNANTAISGLTTAMSSPHWVDYTIYCASGENGSSGGSSAGDKGLDEAAPEIMGFTAEGEEPLAAAKLFKVFNYNNGVRLVEIAGSSDAQLNEEDASALYGQAALRYLVVPEGVEVPAGLEKSFIVVQQPKGNAYVLGSSALAHMADLGKSAAIGMLDAALAQQATDLGIQAMTEEGSKEHINFRAVVTSHIDLVVADYSMLHTENGDSSALQEAGGSAHTLGVPLLVDRSAEEADEVAAAEWIKVYGIVLGCYNEAVDVFESSRA